MLATTRGAQGCCDSKPLRVIFKTQQRQTTVSCQTDWRCLLCCCSLGFLHTKWDFQLLEGCMLVRASPTELLHVLTYTGPLQLRWQTQACIIHCPVSLLTWPFTADMHAPVDRVVCTMRCLPPCGCGWSVVCVFQDCIRADQTPWHSNRQCCLVLYRSR